MSEQKWVVIMTTEDGIPCHSYRENEAQALAIGAKMWATGAWASVKVTYNNTEFHAFSTSKPLADLPPEIIRRLGGIDEDGEIWLKWWVGDDEEEFGSISHYLWRDEMEVAEEHGLSGELILWLFDQGRYVSEPDSDGDDWAIFTISDTVIAEFDAWALNSMASKLDDIQ